MKKILIPGLFVSALLLAAVLLRFSMFCTTPHTSTQSPVMIVVAAGSSLIPRGEAKAATAPEAPPLPWKYAKLDPMEAGKRGYKNYLEKGG